MRQCADFNRAEPLFSLVIGQPRIFEVLAFLVAGLQLYFFPSGITAFFGSLKNPGILLAFPIFKGAALSSEKEKLEPGSTTLKIKMPFLFDFSETALIKGNI